MADNQNTPAGADKAPAAPSVDKRVEALEKLVNSQAEQINKLAAKLTGNAAAPTSVNITKQEKPAPILYKDGSKTYDVIMPRFQAENKDGILEEVDLSKLDATELKVWFGKMPHAFKLRN